MRGPEPSEPIADAGRGGIQVVRRAAQILRALEAAVREMADIAGGITVVDNDSGDGSYEKMRDTVAEERVAPDGDSPRGTVEQRVVDHGIRRDLHSGRVGPVDVGVQPIRRAYEVSDRSSACPLEEEMLVASHAACHPLAQRQFMPGDR